MWGGKKVGMEVDRLCSFLENPKKKLEYIRVEPPRKCGRLLYVNNLLTCLTCTVDEEDIEDLPFRFAYKETCQGFLREDGKCETCWDLLRTN